MNKEINKLVRQLKREGWSVTETGHKHFKLTAPNGKSITCSRTPSSPHAVDEVKRDIRKYIYGRE